MIGVRVPYAEFQETEAMQVQREMIHSRKAAGRAGRRANYRVEDGAGGGDHALDDAARGGADDDPVARPGLPDGWMDGVLDSDTDHNFEEALVRIRALVT